MSHLDGHADGHGRARRSVDTGVGEQVGDDLAQPSLVALHDDRAVGHDERHRPVGVDGAGVLGGVGCHRHQVDGEALERELEELGSDRSLDDGFDMCSMIWFVITDEETDQTPNGKLSNLLVGTAAQITDNLKRYRDAGMDHIAVAPVTALVMSPSVW